MILRLLLLQSKKLCAHAVLTLQALLLQCNVKKNLRKARYESNQALSLAQHYRNVAEERQSEKRNLKSELEQQVEVVRDFWRNKVIEGSSRSGRILRAALSRK